MHEAPQAAEAEHHDRIANVRDRTIQPVEGGVDHGQHLGDKDLVLGKVLLQLDRLRVLFVQQGEKPHHQLRQRRDEVALVEDFPAHPLLLGDVG